MESMYHVWLTKQGVLKFRCLYLMCGSRKKSFKVTEPMRYHVWLTKQEVVKFRCVDAMCGCRKKTI